MHFSTLLIDLDDTVYPAETGVWKAIRQRIDLYVAQKFHLPMDEARHLRQQLFFRYGTTMRGLQAEYHLDEDEYLAFVHDVPLADYLHPDPELGRVMGRYPQRRVIFTNADANHARRVLKVLGLEDCFERIIDIKATSPYCKPMQEAFQIALEKCGEVDPSRCVLVDDQSHNVRAGRAQGMHVIRVGTSPDPDADATIQRLVELPAVLPCEGGEIRSY